MFARRLVTSLVLLALVSNISVFANVGARVRSASEGQAFTLVSLKHETVGASTRILIESTAPPLYTVFRPSGRLIVVDLPGGEGSQLAARYVVKNSLVDSIMVRQPGDGADAHGRASTRIEVAIHDEVQDRTMINGNTLVLELSPDPQEGKAKDSRNNARVEPREAKSAPVSPGVYVYPTAVASRNVVVNPQPAGVPASPAPKVDRAAPPATALRPATLIRSVRSETADGILRVVVDADGGLQFKDFILPDPWRVVVDITGVRSAFGNKTTNVGFASVDRLRVGQPGQNVVRIVLDARSKVNYRVAREGESLVITVGNAGVPRGDAERKGAEVKARQNSGSIKEAAQTPADHEVKVAGQRVENKNQSGEPAGMPSNLLAQAGRTSAGGAGTGQRVTSPQPNRSLPLPNQPASSNPASSNSGKEVITGTAPSSTARSVMDVQRSASPQHNPASSGVQPNQASRQRAELAFCDPGYAGGLISFDLRAGVDIRDMLRFISQQYGINFIVDKSVAAVPVDIRVTDIPWNQVMESVLRANRLGAVCESNGRMIRIATLSAVKEEEEQRRQLAEEQSKQVPLVTKIIHLKYARAVGALGATGAGASGRSGGGASAGSSSANGSTGTLLSIVNSRLSPRGRIEMDARTNSLIVTDLPEYTQVVEDMIARLDRPEPQVEIEARIVIASRNFLRDIGSELAAGALGSRGKAGLFETTPVQMVGGGLAPGGKDAGGSGSSGGSTGGSSGGSAGGATQNKGLGPNLVGPFATDALRGGAANTVLSLTTGLIGTSIISAALSASETKGQARTIASPRITTTDNKTAEIVNGVQIPVQTVSNNTITTTFVTAALRLEITPQIIEEKGEVLMHVVAENNTVNFNLAGQFNNGTPGIDTQSAESTVLIQDGGTTVMGGINVDTEGNTVNRTPGISRVPMLGELFKHKSTRREASEILFFITPRIVRPDGMIGPRVPQRSSVEGMPNPNAPQRASIPPAPQAGQKSQPDQQARAAANAKAGQ
jgi:type IV pilus assembly protein PilQ